MEQIIIGIDISSKTLDICVKKEQGSSHFAIANDMKSIRAFLKKQALSDAIVAMENTGRYTWNLLEVLATLTFQVYLISPLHLKKSLGLARGKNDKIDAARICAFISKNKDELPVWKPAPVAVRQLKVLLAERNTRVKMKRQLLNQQHDYRLMKPLSLDRELLRLNKKMLACIEAQIKEIEKKIEEITRPDSSLAEQARLLRSVPGVGKVLCWTVLAKTEGFTQIESPRKMACYCGVAPFEHQSGTSLRYKPGVSPLADKSLKCALHMAAMSAVRLNNDLGRYYRRKVDEGKNKMATLNAVRNKIIHRMYAVIKNQTPYKNELIIS